MNLRSRVITQTAHSTLHSALLEELRHRLAALTTKLTRLPFKRTARSSSPVSLSTDPTMTLRWCDTTRTVHSIHYLARVGWSPLRLAVLTTELTQLPFKRMARSS